MADLGNVCPICDGKFGSAVFESHVDLCIKQSMMKEAHKPAKKVNADDLVTQVQKVEEMLFGFLENLEQADRELTANFEVVKAARHLGNSITNAQTKLINMYKHMGVDLGVQTVAEAMQKQRNAPRSDYIPPPPPPQAAASDADADADPVPSPSPARSARSAPAAQRAVGAGDSFERKVPAMNSEQELQLQEFLRKESTCAICKKHVGQQKILAVPNCEHKVCEACMRNFLRRLLASNSFDVNNLLCPADDKCLHTVPQWMWKRVLSEEDNEKLLQLSLAGVMGDLVTCPNPDCGFRFEPMQGNLKASGDEKGVDGKPMSADAKLHKAKHRFRCQKCTTIFCSGCDSIPYHIGFTCNEFKNYKEARHCRFCETQLTADNTAPMPQIGAGPGLEDICTGQECLTKRKYSCVKKHACGHSCGGVRNEKECLQCLHSSCGSDTGGDEFCNICWVESLDKAPAIKLTCGHIFHYTCVRERIKKKWVGARITFGFLNCPLCKKTMDHPLLEKDMTPFVRLRDAVQKKALQRLQYEGLDNDARLTDPNSSYYKKPKAYAMDRFAYYPCYKCRIPYFGGRRACEDAAAEADGKYDPKELVCGSCTSGNDVLKCKVHGKDFIEFKCKWCCSVASFFCWGTTHFCESCHKRQEKGDYLTKKKREDLDQCPGVAKCPLAVKHPPNGEEFALGCGICRHNKAF